MSKIRDIFNKNTFKLVIGELKYNKRANWWSAGAIIFILLTSVTMATMGKNMYVRNAYNFMLAFIPSASFRKYYYKENRAGLTFKLPASRGESAVAFYMVQYIYSIGTFLTIMGLTVGFAGYLDMNYIFNYSVFFMFTLIVDVSMNIDTIFYIKEYSKRDYYKLNTITALAGLGFFYCLIQPLFVRQEMYFFQYAPIVLLLQVAVLVYQQTINFRCTKQQDYIKRAWSSDTQFLMNSIVSESNKTK